MNFRVTPSIQTMRSIYYAQRHQASLGQSQEQLSSGLRINRPSDAPLAMRPLLLNRFYEKRLDVQNQNTQDARSQLNAGVTQLTEVKNALLKAKDVALQSHQTQEHETLAHELDELLERVQEIANHQFADAYLFSGTAANVKPFEFAHPSGRATYAGGSDRTQIVVGVQVTVDVIYSGREVFQPNDRGETIYVGQTGAKAGSGTDNAVGWGELIVRHVATSFAPGSGVAAGASSVDSDTIVGPAGAHQLYIEDTSGTGAAGIVRLNDGNTVQFTSVDSDLVVHGQPGEVVHLDMTNIAAGFTGFVDITADGVASVDGGVTELPIGFADNQTLADSVTGHVTHVDTTDVRLAGIDKIEYGGTSDVFQAITELRDDLLNTRDLEGTDWHDSLDRRIGDLQRLIEHVIGVVGEQAVTLESLDAIELHHEEVRLETQTVISDLESADITEVVLNMHNAENLLEMTYASSVRLLDQSLLDFLR